MASSRTIDSLVVLLGLNAKGFSQGIKGSTTELASFTKRVTGMFVAFRGLEDVVDYFKDLNSSLAQLKFTANNLGVAATQLSRLGEVSKLYGGQAQDAQASVQSLQASLFSLRYQGQMSEPLMMLQRFGVAYMTASGQMLNFKSIALNAAKVIDQQFGTGPGRDQGMATQMALSMGFTGGIANAVAQGAAGFEARWTQAGKNQKSLTDPVIASEAALARRLTALAYQVQANSAVILSKLAPAIGMLATDLAHLTITFESRLLPLLNQWVPKIDADLKGLSVLLDRLTGGGKKGEGGKSGKSAPWYDRLGATFGLSGLEDAAARLAGKKLGLLGAAGAAASGHPGKAVELAISALSWQGMAAMLGIDALKNLGAFSNKENPLSVWLDKQNFSGWLKGITGSPFAAAAGGGIAIPPSFMAAPPPTPTAPRPGASASPGTTPPIAMVGAGGTNVEIGGIYINTQATTAQGIANGIGPAVRKVLTSSADRGQS